MAEMTAPRMRTLPQALNEIKKLDPETAVTMRALRRMITNGDIGFVPVASKRLINLDKLLDYLANPPAEALQAEKTGGIRAVKM